MISNEFLLAVITTPECWPGEAEVLEALLEAGVQKLHIRKPGGGEERELLLQRLAPRWASQLVLHGRQDIIQLAKRYEVPQVHAHWARPWEEGVGKIGEDVALARRHGDGIRLSASLHSWEEVRTVTPGRLEYVFLSPLFDSISKPGYRGGEGLLQPPAGDSPCGLIGLGGIDARTIGQVMDHGWDGAAVLGAIWEKRERAVERFEALKETINEHRRQTPEGPGGSRI